MNRGVRGILRGQPVVVGLARHHYPDHLPVIRTEAEGSVSPMVGARSSGDDLVVWLHD